MKATSFEFDIESLVLKSRALGWLTDALCEITQNRVMFYYREDLNQWYVVGLGHNLQFTDVRLALDKYLELRNELS